METSEYIFLTIFFLNQVISVLLHQNYLFKKKKKTVYITEREIRGQAEEVSESLQRVKWSNTKLITC